MILVRMNESSEATIGLIYTASLQFVAYCLERSGPSSTIANSELRIIPGRYLLKVVKDRVILENVPGRTGIYIHTGNRSTDSKGCLLPGLTRTQQTNFSWVVNHSKAAMDKIIELVNKGDDVLEIIEVE